jgi:hypothetical protein
MSVDKLIALRNGDLKNAIAIMGPFDEEAVMSMKNGARTIPDSSKVNQTDLQEARRILQTLTLAGIVSEPGYSKFVEILREDIETMNVKDLLPREIAPWYGYGLTALSGDPTRLIGDPTSLIARLNASILQAGGIPDRAATAVAGMSFDPTGTLTLGANTATSVRITSAGSSQDPVIGWLYRCLAGNQLLGGPTANIDYSTAAIGGPVINVQVENQIKPGYLYVPFASFRNQNNTTQALVTIAPGVIENQVTSADTQVASDKTLSATTQSDPDFIFQTISGSNMIIQAYPVLLTIDRWFSLMRLIMHNQLHLLGPVIVRDAVEGLGGGTN